MVRDVVCGMDVSEDSPYKIEYKGRTYYFCCEYCLKEFRKNPEKYLSSEDDPYLCGC
ncbi:MAG: YHS domain-containing protein [Thaumarchaeota archaeon]|nr:YHS domain-containing protein [Nitrososphaerota archaeon]MCL7386323.1 YHS domain-containing protein [Candidatus Wolframiiraptor allenii]